MRQDGTGGAPSVGRRLAARVARHRYDRAAPLYDLLEAPMERLRYRRWRAELWRRVGEGLILEAGAGTGRNFIFHPPGGRVMGFDLSPRMLRRAMQKKDESPAEVRLALMDAQDLALRNHVFDVAVATFVFCSVPDPVRGLEELRRALAPGGRLLLLEHVRSPHPTVGRLMDLMNPVMVRLTGANINRDTVGNVRRAGFEMVEVTDLGAGGIYKLIEARVPQ